MFIFINKYDIISELNMKLKELVETSPQYPKYSEEQVLQILDTFDFNVTQGIDADTLYELMTNLDAYKPYMSFIAVLACIEGTKSSLCWLYTEQFRPDLLTQLNFKRPKPTNREQVEQKLSHLPFNVDKNNVNKQKMHEFLRLTEKYTKAKS